jgi:hypothetical protein
VDSLIWGLEATEQRKLGPLENRQVSGFSSENVLISLGIRRKRGIAAETSFRVPSPITACGRWHFAPQLMLIVPHFGMSTRICQFNAVESSDARQRFLTPLQICFEADH